MVGDALLELAEELVGIERGDIDRKGDGDAVERAAAGRRRLRQRAGRAEPQAGRQHGRRGGGLEEAAAGNRRVAAVPTKRSK